MPISFLPPSSSSSSNSRFHFRPHPLGDECVRESLHVFFGQRHANVGTLRQAFPQYQFLRLKQTHSSLVHRVSHRDPDFAIAGDAAWTQERGLSLCSITADCMPVFIYSPEPLAVASIHAGWRGVAHQIVVKTMASMATEGIDLRACQFFLGPHILRQSFEVENSVRDEILHSLTKENLTKDNITTDLFTPLNSARSLVDLSAVVAAQIESSGGRRENIHRHLADTKTNLLYHSFRRDRDSAGRQISFAVLRAATE
ncbi:MAG: hypothetical protein C5B49_05905 [Bdellovibrio sp.]|nr:MAG: hypothetical protein C5B49_05905 [Bdellovibrio sp.]